jgi:hypothetical protein
MTGNTGNLTLEESIKRLTIGETKHLERASGKTMGDLSGPEMTAGVIYLFKRREALAQGLEFPTLGEAEAYFSPEEIEVDPEDPETPSGKDSTSSE